MTALNFGAVEYIILQKYMFENLLNITIDFRRFRLSSNKYIVLICICMVVYERREELAHAVSRSRSRLIQERWSPSEGNNNT
jgi:hypothetical protein